MDKTKIIAVANQKGGVGKTTTAVNLGVGLARFGKRVLLIDTDPQASLTLSLGISEPDELSHSLASVFYDVIENGEVTKVFTPYRNREGVDLIPGNIELSGLEVMLVNEFGRETILKGYVDTVKNDYEYIIIDCMPSLGILTFNALCAANKVAAAYEQLTKEVIANGARQRIKNKAESVR